MPFRQLAAVHEPTNVTTDPSLKKRIKTDDIATHENIMSLRLAHWTDGADRWMPDKCCVAIFKAATTTVSVGRNRHDNSDQDERK